MKEFKDKNYKLIMGISIACLVLIIFASSYAYFKTKIINNTNPFSVKVGKVDLLIDTNQITIENAAPILDEDKNEKAITKTFTIKRTSDSNLDICYNLYLVIDQITDNIKNSKYLKYELTDKKSGEVISKNLSTVVYSEGKSTILLKNQYLSDSDTSGVEYELKVWLSYDEVEDQTSLLGGSLTAHLYVSGMQGTTCPASVETIPTPTPTLKDKLLADNPTIQTRSSFSAIFTTTNTGTLYKATESIASSTPKDVYYFAGDAKNNWVKFAGFYWRIIRTNHDGSIRLLYSGTSPDTTEGYIVTSPDTTEEYIGKSTFNSTYDDPMYVGYMYGTSGSLASNRTNTNNSTIKTYIDNWYSTNLSSYSKYISTEAVYCNDRKAPSYNASSSFDYYVYTRLNAGNPTYDCEDSKDAFSESNNEAKLTYPIGLMTADEITYAGGYKYTSLTSPYAWYYLNSAGGSITGGAWWWLLSPSRWDGNDPTAWRVVGSGALRTGYVDTLNGVRPAISLKTCTLWTSGNGAPETPYEIVENGGC